MHELRLEMLHELSMPVVRVEGHDCPYLPGRVAQEIVAVSADPDSERYGHLLEHGFRRSGMFLYRAACPSCSACESLRVPVERFQPSRSQRSVWRRNQDVEVTCDPSESNDERFDLFMRYQDAQHAKPMLQTRQEYDEFLGSSPINTMDMLYRLDGRLIGVGVVDITPAALSSVYFYFDPDESRRSPGTFSALCEIEACRERRLPYWYAGYYIHECGKMNYKARFRPHELRDCGGAWRASDEDGG